jgi:hypothetical protein
MGRIETYEEWRKVVLKREQRDPHWMNAGDWFYPTIKANLMYKGKMFHICEVNWRLDQEYKSSMVATKRPEVVADRCEACGEEIPEGIKMIAMLLSW